MRTLDYDDLVYGNNSLSMLVAKHPETKDGLTRFLYEIILRRMEIRDKSRSVSSVDVVFNFDAIGFTGTPFIDNYPTYAYIRSQREDTIPDMIDRSFYAYTREALDAEAFGRRFATFQGRNSHVQVEYVSSDFMQVRARRKRARARSFACPWGMATWRAPSHHVCRAPSVQGADDELALLADIFGRASLLPSGYRETGDWSRDGGADLNGRERGDVSPAAAELAEAARALLH